MAKASTPNAPQLTDAEELALKLANSYLQSLLDAVPELEAVSISFAWEKNGPDDEPSEGAEGVLKARDDQLSLQATVALSDAATKFTHFTTHLLAEALDKAKKS